MTTTTTTQCKHENKKTGVQCRNKVLGRFQYCHRHRKTNKAAAVSNGWFSTPKETIPSPIYDHKVMRKRRSKVLAGTLGRRGVPPEIRGLITEKIGDGQSDFEKQLSGMQMQIIEDKFLIKGVPKLVRDSMGLPDSTFVLVNVERAADGNMYGKIEFMENEDTSFIPTNISVIREVAGVIMSARFLANQIRGVVFEVRITASEEREVTIKMLHENNSSSVVIVASASSHYTGQEGVFSKLVDMISNTVKGLRGQQ